MRIWVLNYCTLRVHLSNQTTHPNGSWDGKESRAKTSGILRYKFNPHLCSGKLNKVYATSLHNGPWGSPPHGIHTPVPHIVSRLVCLQNTAEVMICHSEIGLQNIVTSILEPLLSLSLSFSPSLPLFLPPTSPSLPFSLNTHSGEGQLPSHQDTLLIMQRGPCGKELRPANIHMSELGSESSSPNVIATPADSLTTTWGRRVPEPETPS